MCRVNRQYTSVEILEWENNALAIERAVEVLKDQLADAPTGVLNDVMRRCDPKTHDDLIGWIADQPEVANSGRLPRAWSPKRNRRLWMLYAAADLERPENPPRTWIWRDLRTLNINKLPGLRQHF